MHPQKKEGMSAPIKSICSILLLVCAFTLANRQDYANLPEIRAQESYSECIRAQIPAASETIEHLYIGQVATPIHALFKSTSSSSNKFKGTLSSEAPGRMDVHFTHTHGFLHLPPQHCLHAIDYYIYTLERIII